MVGDETRHLGDDWQEQVAELGFGVLPLRRQHLLFVRECVCFSGEFPGRVRGLFLDEGECGCLCGLCGELSVDFLVAECGCFGVDCVLGEGNAVFLDRIPFPFEGCGERVYGVFRVAAELRAQVCTYFDDFVGLVRQLVGCGAAVFQLGADQGCHFIVLVSGESDGVGGFLCVGVDLFGGRFENVVHGAH